jgi:fibronectin-binding autotransporter adhesin
VNQINRRAVELAALAAIALTLICGSPLRAQEATLLNLQNATASPYTLYSYTYTAVLTQTYITFQFRQDPSYYNLDNVSITPLGSGTALAVNGNFEGSTSNMGGQLVPNGWTFVGQAGLTAGGTTAAGCGIGGSACWHDGSVGGVDGLFQSFATTIGSQYTISFELTNLGGGTNEAVVQVGASEDVGGVLVPVPPPPPTTDIVAAGSPHLAAGLGTTLNPVFDGGTLQLDNSGLAVSQAFTVNSTNGTINTAGLTSTLGGVLSGPGGLTFANSGSGGNVTLTNSNTYQGATTINAGAALALSGAGGIANSSGVADNGSFDISATTAGASIQTLSGNGSVALGAQTLTLTNASTTFAGAIGGTGGVAVTGGSQTLSGINTYSGATVIGAGTTLALIGSGSIASSSALADAGTFNISGTTAGASVQSLSGAGTVTLGSRTLTLSNASTSFAGAINGNGPVQVIGGSETFTGSNGYTGNTAIGTAATLALTGSGSITASSGVVDNGTLDLSGETADASLQTLSGTGTVALGAQRLTLANASTTFAGAINGTGAVSITGGTETFSGGNNYSGGTTVSGGANVSVAADASLGAAAGGLALNAGTLATTASFTTGRNVALTGNGTFNTSAGTTLTDMTGSVSGAGALIKSGTGTLTLCGAVSNTGGTAVNAGTLTICGADTGIGSTAIATGATLAVAGAGSIASASAIADSGTLDISGASAGASLRSLSGTGSVTLGIQNLTLTNASATFAGVIGGSGGLEVSGGTETLSGVNTYGGATSIDSGASLILAGPGSIAASASIADNGTFDVSGASAGSSVQSLAGSGAVALGAQTLTLTNASSTFAGDIAGTGGVAVTGGTETLAGSNTYMGGTAISGGGTIVVASDAALGAATGALTLNNGTLATTATFTSARALVLTGDGAIDVAGCTAFIDSSGVVSGAGALIKTGSGSLSLCGGVSNVGGTMVAAGLLNLCGVDTATGNTVIASGATLSLSGGASIASSSGVADNGVLDISAISAGAMVQSLSGTGTVALGAQNLTLTNASAVFAGVIGGSGGVAVTGGTETFSGANTYTGGTTVSGGARVIVGSDAALGNTAGALTLNNGTLEASTSFTSTRSLVLQGAATFDEDPGATLTQAGPVSGSGHVTKDGDGTLVLAGDNRNWGIAGNTALGGITINDGLVEVTNSYGLGYGVVTLNSGAIATTVDILTGQTILIGGNTVLNTDAGTTTTLSGTVETDGTGQCFLKTGAGTLIVAGPTTLSNGTCVEDGRLSANGTLNSVVTVDVNGTLRGTGTITGPITVYGTLAPGNSPGTLTVTASVTMASGSVFQDDINGTGIGSGPGNYSRLLVQGAGNQFIASGATLDINLLNITGAVAYTPYVPLLGDSFRIVTADGGIVGRFAAFAQPAGLASGTRAALFYDQLGDNSIDVRVVPLSYSAFLQTHGGNASAVSTGHALDQILDADQAATASATQDQLAFAVAGLNAAELPRVLSALSGEVHADMAVIAPEADQWLQRSVARQLDAGDAEPIGAAQPGDALWMDSTINKGKWNSDAQGSGFIANREQIAFGFDLMLGQPNRLGIGFSHSLTDVAAAAGYGSVEENMGFVYGQVSLSPLVVDALFGAGSSRWDTTRADPLNFTTQSLTANPHANNSLASLGLRWPMHVTGLVLAPYVRALWQRNARDNFSEGAAIDALSGPGYEARGLRSTAGLSGGSVSQSPLASVLTYQFDLGIAHDTGRLGRPVVNASLQGAAIEDQAPETGRTFVLANITGTVRLGAHTYVYLGLSEEARSGKSEDGGINAGVRARF